jgi:hypothetical protein
MADLDVLTQSERDFARLEQLLLDQGYLPGYRLFLGRRLSRSFTHHFHYFRDGLTVEAHWVMQRHCSFRIDYDRVWSTTTTVDFRGRSYQVLSAEYELVLRILGALTDLQVGRLTLKPFVDMYTIVRATPLVDWNEFFWWRRREKIFDCSRYFLNLLLELFDCHGELEQLAQARGLQGAAGQGSPTARLQVVLNSRRFDWRQKLTAIRLYETALPTSLAWWAISLPFRLAVYQEGDGPLLRRRSVV